MHWRKVAVMAFGLTLGVLAIVVLFPPERGTYKPPYPPRKPSDVTITNKWESADFVPVRPLEALKVAIEGMNVGDDGVRVTEEQERMLKESVFLVLSALGTGDFNRYERFRFPVTNGVYDKQLSEFRLKNLKAKGAQVPDGITSDMGRQVLRLSWNFWAGSKADNFDSRLCAGCVEGVAVDRTSFWIKKVTGILTRGQGREGGKRSERLLEPLWYFAQRFENVGTSQEKATIRFRPSLRTLLEEEGSAIVATIRTLVDVKEDPAHPILIRWYWVDRYNEWLPYQFGSGFTWKRRYSYMF